MAPQMAKVWLVESIRPVAGLSSVSIDTHKLCEMANLIGKFKPLFDRVLVQKLVAETTTRGGILLPEKSVGKMLQATVVAVGDGGRDQNGNVVPVSVSVGDSVLLPEYGGTKIEMNEQEYLIFRDTDILGKFED